MVKPSRGTDPLLRRPFSIFEILRDATGTPPASRSSTSASASAHGCSTTRSPARALALPRTARPAVRAGRSAGRRRGWSPAASASRPFSRSPRRCVGAGTPATLFYGARRRRELYYVDVFERLGVRTVLATEDGSRGAQRLHHRPARTRARRRCRPAKPVKLYVCGPTPMMRAVRDDRATFHGRAVRRLARAGHGLRPRRLLQLRRAHRGRPARRRTSSARASTARSSTRAHRLGGAGTLSSTAWISRSRIGSLHAPQSAHRGERLLRLRRRVRRRRRSLDARRRRGQGAVPRRARRAPAAAHRRDAGRHAERDRPAGHRRAPLRRARSCPSCAIAARSSSSTSAGRRSTSTSRWRASCRDAEGVAAIELNISCPNIKEGGITFGCSLTGTHDVVSAVRKVTHAAGHSEADAERHRRRVVRARRGRGRRRRGLARQHVPGDGHRRRNAPAEALEHRRRAERPGDPADRGAHGLRVPAGREDADHRHGRHRARAADVARVHDRRRDRRAGRHGELRRPVHLVARCSMDCSDYMTRHRHQRAWPTSPAALDTITAGTRVDQLLVALDVEHGVEAARARGSPPRTSSADSRSATGSSPPKAPTSFARSRRAATASSSTSSSTTSRTPSRRRSPAATSLGVWMVNVHAVGRPAHDAGRARRRARDRRRAKAGTPPLVIAVTVLTSLNAAMLGETGVQRASDRSGAAAGGPRAGGRPRWRRRLAAGDRAHSPAMRTRFRHRHAGHSRRRGPHARARAHEARTTRSGRWPGRGDCGGRELPRRRTADYRGAERPESGRGDSGRRAEDIDSVAEARDSVASAFRRKFTSPREKRSSA